VADQFADGAWFVDLVPVTDPAMIAPAIAAALGLGEHHSRSAEDTVLGWLADRETLLMLDNCEHLLSGVVGLLERLLAGCAGLSVLATSRGAAASRHFGNEALRLHRAAVDAALRAGDRAAAAGSLARAAELINRGPGMMAKRPAAGEADALLAKARTLAAGDPAVEARTLTAEAFTGSALDPVTAELAERAITLAAVSETR
jgi:predicted ATPase